MSNEPKFPYLHHYISIFKSQSVTVKHNPAAVGDIGKTVLKTEGKILVCCTRSFEHFIGNTIKASDLRVRTLHTYF